MVEKNKPCKAYKYKSYQHDDIREQRITATNITLQMKNTE